MSVWIFLSPSWRYRSGTLMKFHFAHSKFVIDRLGKCGCIQKFPDWRPGARTANGAALYH